MRQTEKEREKARKSGFSFLSSHSHGFGGEHDSMYGLDSLQSFLFFALLVVQGSTLVESATGTSAMTDSRLFRVSFKKCLEDKQKKRVIEQELLILLTRKSLGSVGYSVFLFLSFSSQQRSPDR